MSTWTIDPIEWVASISGVISVIFSWKRNILTYPLGLISVSIYVYLCFQNGLYADMGINVFYFLMSIYGWINWRRLWIQNGVFIPRNLSTKNQVSFLILTLIFWMILWYILENYTDSNVALADGFTTAVFITGMILMASKFIENWIYLVVGNIISVPLYLYKGLYVSSVFFVILTVFGTIGYIKWREDLNKKNT